MNQDKSLTVTDVTFFNPSMNENSDWIIGWLCSNFFREKHIIVDHPSVRPDHNK